jgi:ferric-dicitrate binding protein FerR (iron transport regulator)
MALSVPGLDADLIGKLKGGDLGSFEKLFRAAYPALLVKAKEVLDDDSAAARVIERVMPRLFADRAGLTTPDSLVGMLEGSVHEAAVRERARLAGLRKHSDGTKKATTPPPSIDDVWGRISAVIKGPSPEQLAMAGDARAKVAHEAAEHFKKATKKRSAAAVAGIWLGVLAAVAGGVWGINAYVNADMLARQVASDHVRIIGTGTGQRGNVTLDDGTTAMFGAESRARVPTKFGEIIRGIGLDGAAEFTVANEAKPFQVLAKNVRVTVEGPGTVVALNAYADGDMVFARVKQGTAKVDIDGGESRTLTAGQSLAVSKDGDGSTPDERHIAEAFGYLDERFVQTKKPLKAMLASIRRWYGVSLSVKDTTLAARVIDSLAAPLTSSTEAIKAIEAASGLVFGWEGKNMVLLEKK